MMEEKKIKVISEKDIIATIGFLRTKNREPTRANVAEDLGVRPESLIRWSKRNRKPLKDLGIVEASRERKISEAKIKKAVEELKREKIKPTIATVSKKLGVKKGSLSRWSVEKKKPLEVYGIHVMRPITEARIRDAVKLLKKQQEKPTRKAVAKILEVYFKSLSTWSSANKIPLEKLGVAMWRPNVISEVRIKKAVGFFKKKGIRPTRYNVAKKLGLTYTQLTKWAFRRKISLGKLGLFTKTITKTKIEKIVESFEKKKKTPTTEEVAKELGVKEKCLLDWIKRNKTSVEKLRIAKRERKRKISKELIRQAVRELKQIKQRPTPKNVAKKIGIYIGSLYKWSSENKIPLKDLGIVLWKRISRESIEEAIKALELENKEVTTSNVAEKLEVKVHSLYRWSSNVKTPLKDLGIIISKKIPKPHKAVIKKIVKKERLKKEKIEAKITPEEKEIKAEQERLLKMKEFIDTFNKAKELFETKEPEKLKNAISLFEETITQGGKELGEKDIPRKAEDYLDKIRNLIKEQFEQAEEMLLSGWPENAIPLFELVINLEEPFQEKTFTLSAYKGLREAKEKLREKEEKLKQWEVATGIKNKIQP